MLYGKKLWYLLGLFGIFLPIAIRPPARAEGASIVINELMWMGSSASSADEWIELRNTTDQTVDISHWSITKKSSGQEVPMLELPPGVILPPDGLFVISNYANSSSSTVLNVLPGLVTTDVALGNSALQIKLYDATHQLIDTADDGVGNPFAGALDAGQHVFASAERNPVPGDGALAQNWHTATRGIGLKTAAVERATPGAQNSNGLPIAKAGADQTGVTGVALNFDASESSDPEGLPLQFSWDFGDGTVDVTATPRHTFAAAGAYVVMLTVTDGTDSASDTVKVTVSDAPAAATPPSATADEPTEQPELVTTTSCLGLHLSEVYPNPPGVDQDEFIELVNDGDEDIVVGSCAVFSSATRSFRIPAGTTVLRGTFLTLPKSQTHLTLNNGGTTVRLVDSDGAELDRLTYGAAKEGTTWANVNSTWLWTAQPTPGERNRKVVVAPSSTKATNAAKASTKASTVKKQEPPALRVELVEVQELDSGDRVVVRGTVTTPRDTLGSTTAFIQSEAGGLNLTIPNGEASITPGQTIEVTGTVRLKNGRRYVAVAAKSLRVVSTASLPIPPLVPTDEVGVDQADQLVHVKGVVSLASGNRIEIDDGSGPVPIYLRSSTGIVRPKVKAGDTVDAVGIVSISTSGIRVLPRMQDDLHVARVLGASTAQPVSTVVAPAASRNQTTWYWSMVAAGALVALARPMWKRMQERSKKTL